MKRLPAKQNIKQIVFHFAVLAGAVVSAPTLTLADESGVSFWVPGLFGSLAATPQQPGFFLATINYFTGVSAGKGVDFQHGGAIFANVLKSVLLCFDESI